jgi:hypothetical protein
MGRTPPGKDEELSRCLDVLQGAVKATESRVEALEDAVTIEYVAELQGTIDTLKGAVNGTNIRVDALQNTARAANLWDKSLQLSVETMTSRILALESTINATNPCTTAVHGVTGVFQEDDMKMPNVTPNNVNCP